MKEKILIIKESYAADLKKAISTKELEDIRIKFLGKKGIVQELMQELRLADATLRPVLGKEINLLKTVIEEGLTVALEQSFAAEESKKLQEESLDITLPGKKRHMGNKHLVQHVLDMVIDIMIEMGFSVQYGPDIDSEYYNFESLNFAKDHPARDMQDTFYISENMLLRTQTSNIQGRIMEKNKPPIRIISPGKCFRNETVTARSHVFFHQVEALYIDTHVTFADLLATLDEFLEKLFGKKMQTRYRPSYFPFVEPGMEVDVHCLVCDGKGCAVCKHTGWLEVAGAGMVHPEVLKNGGIDAEEFSGYAWGLGIERLVMLKYGIEDIRIFTQNDIRFLNQFQTI